MSPSKLKFEAYWQGSLVNFVLLLSIALVVLWRKRAIKLAPFMGTDYFLMKK